jgi:Putative Ig domain
MFSWRRRVRKTRPYVRSFRPLLEQLENRLVPALTLDPIQPQIVFENQHLALQVIAHSTDESPLLVFSFDQTQPGATIDPKTGVFNWTPEEVDGAAGFNFTVRVTDLRGQESDEGPETAAETFNVLVLENPKAPILQPISNQTIVQGGTAIAQAVAQDEDNPPSGIVYSLTAAPGGAAIDPVSGVFQWKSAQSQLPGVYAVTVRAANADAPALFAETTFLITVTPLLTDIAPVKFLPGGSAGNQTPVAFNAGAFTQALGNIPQSGALPPPPLFIAPQGPGTDANAAARNLGEPLELQMDRLPQKPLKLNNTEGNSDGSSVDRLYQDFLGPAPLGDDSVMNPLSDSSPTDASPIQAETIESLEKATQQGPEDQHTGKDADAFWCAEWVSANWI